eukprot:COSAG02_NODE_4227_length_5610_cov_4.036654_6_plen_206_part_00
MGCASSRKSCADGRGKHEDRQRSVLPACAARTLASEPVEPALLGAAAMRSLASLDREEARKQFFRSSLGAELGKAIVNDNTWDFEASWNAYGLRQVPGLLQLIIAVARERCSLKVLRYLEGIDDGCGGSVSPTLSASGRDTSSLTEPEVMRSVDRYRAGSTRTRKRRWSKRQLVQQAGVGHGGGKPDRSAARAAAVEEGSGRAPG